MALNRQRRPHRFYIPVGFYKGKPKVRHLIPGVIKAAIVVSITGMTPEQVDKAYPLNKKTLEARTVRRNTVARMRESLSNANTTPAGMCNHAYGITCGVCGVYTPYPKLMRASNNV